MSGTVTTVVVFGASGDLAKKKIYPVLWSLYRKKLVDRNVCMIGYARRDLDLVSQIRPFLEKKVAAGDEALFEEFLSKLTYFKGQYDQKESLAALDVFIGEQEAAAGLTGPSNRVLYLALPQTTFVPITECIRSSCWSEAGWNRVVVEKPFGKDAASSEVLSVHLTKLFDEREIYRIDHYLGKEMVQDLFQLRFGNRVFSSIWNRDNISTVQITFKEDFGTKGRGGYFDESGILRDILQNHLLQVLSLVAMEPPVSMDSNDIRDEKVKVLKSIAPVTLDDCVLGQYVKSAEPIPGNEESTMGYRDDPTVPDDSTTPTFCTSVLRIKNERWDGVPFIMRAGKALDQRKAEIRIQFKEVPGSMFTETVPRNELVIRIQPDEAVYLKVIGKTPGMADNVISTYLDLTYKERFDNYEGIDAYERLILDVLVGQQQHFVRSDELYEAWRIWTPVLHQIEGEKVDPIFYEFGSRGPVESDAMIKALGYIIDPQTSAPKPTGAQPIHSAAATPEPPASPGGGGRLTPL